VPTQTAAAATYAQLYPTDGDAQQQEGAEVGYHEGTTTVLGCQSGEAQEITESDSAAGYSQHDVQVGVPCFGFCFL
jgi:hypothetical protein